MVKSIVSSQSTTVAPLAETQTPEKRQQRKLEERKKLQKRAALVGDLRPATRLRFDKPTQNVAKSSPKEALSSEGETREDCAAFEYSLHAIHLISTARKESRELKLRRAFGLSTLVESEIRARVICTTGAAFFKDLLRKKAKSLDRHPVYSRASFLAAESYESWKIAEKQRIDAAKTRLSYLTDATNATSSTDSVSRIWLKGMAFNLHLKSSKKLKPCFLNSL
jgi:hypothetical protein